MDIIITIPQSISWKEYEKELKAVEDGTQVMYFRVPNLPKKANIGDRCYICYRHLVVGWMEIVYIGQAPTFECTTTGTQWPAGNYIGRSGKFHYLKNPGITGGGYPGFQGFRYADPEWRTLEER